MDVALNEARRAAARGEVPVGAVIVRGEEIIARGHNLRELAQDPSAHAEFIAVRAASARIGSWRLDRCELFVTLEPCPMCAGLLVNARIPRVVMGALDPKAGATHSLFSMGSDSRLNHQFETKTGVRGEECGALLVDFFQEIRNRRKQYNKLR